MRDFFFRKKCNFRKKSEICEENSPKNSPKKAQKIVRKSAQKMVTIIPPPCEIFLSHFFQQASEISQKTHPGSEKRNFPKIVRIPRKNVKTSKKNTLFSEGEKSVCAKSDWFVKRSKKRGVKKKGFFLEQKTRPPRNFHKNRIFRFFKNVNTARGSWSKECFFQKKTFLRCRLKKTQTPRRDHDAQILRTRFSQFFARKSDFFFQKNRKKRTCRIPATKSYSA